MSQRRNMQIRYTRVQPAKRNRDKGRTLDLLHVHAAVYPARGAVVLVVERRVEGGWAPAAQEVEHAEAAAVRFGVADDLLRGEGGVALEDVGRLFLVEEGLRKAGEERCGERRGRGLRRLV